MIEIADIRTHLLSVPFSDPPKTGFLTLDLIHLLVVEVEAKDGTIGTGHLHPLGTGIRTLETCVHEMMAPLLVDQDASDPEVLWDRMWQAHFIHGRMGITVMAASALDIAVWDLIGRLRGQPLYALWGGQNRDMPVYGSGFYRGLGHDGMIEKAERFVGQGFSAIKMQVAHLFTEDEDVTNVRDMRAALGDGVEIMVDVNQGLDAEAAISLGRRLDTIASPGWKSPSPPTIGAAITRWPMPSRALLSGERTISSPMISTNSTRVARSLSCSPTSCAAAIRGCAGSRPTPTRPG